MSKQSPPPPPPPAPSVSVAGLCPTITQMLPGVDTQAGHILWFVLLIQGRHYQLLVKVCALSNG